MPIITISRGTMSGGKALAECLAEFLGYRCVARQVVRDAAESLGASPEAFSAEFEAIPGLWSRLTTEREIYSLAMQTALAEICAEGDLIYHGLAGQVLLRDLPCLLRLRLIAPVEMRVGELTRAHHRMDRKSAEELIHNLDRDRGRWAKLMWGVEVEDPLLYDFTINLESISLETACSIIGEMAAQPEYQITEEVKMELEAFAFECRDRLRKAVAARS
ncbi:AAA family ATPase [Gemmatimonadota bacterium]